MNVIEFQKAHDEIFMEKPAGYVLGADHIARPVQGIVEWAENFERGNRIVRQSTVGGSFISTVFLGLDHQYRSGPPLIFETLVFGGPLGHEMDRYSTWDEALRGHGDMVDLVRGVRLGKWAMLIGAFFCIAVLGINPLWFYLGYGARKAWVAFEEFGWRKVRENHET